MSSYSEDLHSAALAYHRLPRPGKLEIQAIKPLANQRDLALAYSPGVAAACMAIAADPAEAASLTIRANLVAVVSNGTAVLGLGNIGPLASKPVMEGKAVLFKKSPASTCSTLKSPPTPSNAWSRPWPRWSRHSAASILRTSRVRSASRSKRSSRRA